jgi:hypothetical protein
MFSLLSSRSPTANVEAYQLAQPVHQVIPSNNPDGVGDTILDFGQTIFGLQTIDIKEWPGLLTYHQHVLAEFYRYGKPWVQLAFSQACGKEAIDFKDVVTPISEVSGIIKSSPDSDCTVLDILQRWLHHHGKDYEQLDAASWADCQSAIFCILTWTTLMIDGDVSPIHSGFQISFPPGYLRAPARQPQDAAARPIASFLRAFGQGPQFPFIDHDAAYSQPSLDLIQITCVNFAMLREFGKVSIEWTTTMTCHLLFSTLTRTLLLFRLPTFCALGCIESSSCMIEWLVTQVHKSLRPN